MFLMSAQNSPDYFIEERQLELEASDYSDPYIEAIIAEKQDLETPEDIGFQDYSGFLAK